LVHDTTRYPREIVLSLLAEKCFFDGIKRPARDRFEQSRRTDLESGATAQAAAEWDSGMQEYVEAPWLDTACLKPGDYATGIISPFGCGWHNRAGKIDRRRLCLKSAA
jgi:hypothetical protein